MATKNTKVQTTKAKSTKATKATKSQKTPPKARNVSETESKTPAKKRKAEAKSAKAETAVPQVKAEKKSSVSENAGMNMARVISNTIGKYFSKFVAVAVSTIACAMVGCAAISGMTTEQKADIAYAASRTATIAWVAIDENSTKYVGSLSTVVSITKEVVDSYCSETNTEFTADFYNTCYAAIETKVDALNLDPVAAEVSKSLAKFSVLECQKVIKMLKSKTPEEAKAIVKAIVDGIDSGLKVDVKSEEYKTALVSLKASEESAALRVKLSAQKAK